MDPVLSRTSPFLAAFFKAMCRETAMERLLTNITSRILIKAQSCFAHFKPVSHKRTRLLNCYLMCLGLTTLSVLHSQAW